MSSTPSLTRPTSPSFHDMMVKTKKFALEKVVKVEATPESNTVIEALDKLKAIEANIDDPLSEIIIKLYNEQLNAAKYKLQLSETLMTLSNFEAKDDLFKNFMENVISRKLFKLNTMNNEYLEKMKKHLIDPVTEYKHVDLLGAHQLIETYDAIKTDYDFAVHRLQKAINTQQKQTKIDNAQTNVNNQFELLQQHRTQIIDYILAELLHKQQTVLLHGFDKFWRSYIVFSECKAQILEFKDNFDDKYETEKNKKHNFNDKTHHFNDNKYDTNKNKKYVQKRQYKRDSRIAQKDLIKFQHFTTKMDERPAGIEICLNIKSMDTNYPIFKLNTDENVHVSDLKRLIEKESPDEIMCLRQRLIHKGRLLKDIRTLKHYKINNEDTIMLVRSTRNQTKSAKVKFVGGVATNTTTETRRRARTAGYKRAQTPDPQQLTQAFQF